MLAILAYNFDLQAESVRLVAPCVVVPVTVWLCCAVAPQTCVHPPPPPPLWLQSRVSEVMTSMGQHGLVYTLQTTQTRHGFKTAHVRHVCLNYGKAVTAQLLRTATKGESKTSKGRFHELPERQRCSERYM